MSIINSLVDLANALDKSELTKEANTVDKISTDLNNIKTAQYVGVQGYWMRNRRCWENCYRQKRSANKGMAAQEVWTECHQEYLESLKDNNSGWEKYAGNKPNLVKTASTTKAASIILSQQSLFNKKIDKKIQNGDPIGYSVFSTFDEVSNSNVSTLIDYASQLAGISKNLADAGHKDLAISASNCSAGLIKESQFWGGNRSEFGPGFSGKTPDQTRNQGFGGRAMDWGRSFMGNAKAQWNQRTDQGQVKNIQNQISNMMRMLDSIAQSGDLDNPNSRSFQQLYQQLTREITNLSSAAAQSQNQQVKSLAQSVIPTVQSFLSNAKPGQRRNQMNTLKNNLSSILSQVGQVNSPQGNANPFTQQNKFNPQQPQPQQAQPQQSQQAQQPQLTEVEGKALAANPQGAVNAALAVPEAKKMLENYLEGEGYVRQSNRAASSAIVIKLSYDINSFANWARLSPQEYIGYLAKYVSVDDIVNYVNEFDKSAPFVPVGSAQQDYTAVDDVAAEPDAYHIDEELDTRMSFDEEVQDEDESVVNELLQTINSTELSDEDVNSILSEINRQLELNKAAMDLMSLNKKSQVVDSDKKNQPRARKTYYKGKGRNPYSRKNPLEKDIVTRPSRDPELASGTESIEPNPDLESNWDNLETNRDDNIDSGWDSIDTSGGVEIDSLVQDSRQQQDSNAGSGPILERIRQSNLSRNQLARLREHLSKYVNQSSNEMSTAISQATRKSEIKVSKLLLNKLKKGF